MKDFDHKKDEPSPTLMDVKELKSVLDHSAIAKKEEFGAMDQKESTIILSLRSSVKDKPIDKDIAKLFSEEDEHEQKEEDKPEKKEEETLSDPMNPTPCDSPPDDALINICSDPLDFKLKITTSEPATPTPAKKKPTQEMTALQVHCIPKITVATGLAAVDETPNCLSKCAGDIEQLLNSKCANMSVLDDGDEVHSSTKRVPPPNLQTSVLATHKESQSSVILRDGIVETPEPSTPRKRL